MFKPIVRYAPVLAMFGMLASGASAADAERVVAAAPMKSVTVNYADLNLNTPAGVEALYARLRAASRSVCDLGLRRALAEVVASRSCFREVLATAVGSANMPTLTARHRTASGFEG